MNEIDLIVAAIVVGYILLINLFAAAMHAKAIIERGELLPSWILYPLYIGALVGLVLDVLFNVVCGTYLFRELPREFTFTSRCKRHKASGGWRASKAKAWCAQLNKFDPGHC